MIRKTCLSWEEYGKAIRELSQLVKNSKLKFDGIYGVPRGGLPIAVALSHNLKLPLLMYPTNKSLVCDDISDRGKTLKSYKHSKIACLFSTPWTTTIPDFSILKKEDENSWIIFPYENIEDEN